MIVDLDDISGVDLAHLAAIKIEDERRQAEELTARLVELYFERPALGRCRRWLDAT